MKYGFRVLIAVLMLGLIGSLAFAGKDPVTMKGSYVWERSDQDIPGEIEVVFTPTGKDTWDVLWTFEWEGEMRNWNGTATGSLETGKLEGESLEDRDRKRTFAFKGEIQDGVFNGTHGRMRDGEWRDSGTLTLSP